jgi:hypothetical protein
MTEFTGFTDKEEEDIFVGTWVPGGPPDQCKRDASSGDGVLRDDAQDAVLCQTASTLISDLTTLDGKEGQD